MSTPKAPGAKPGCIVNLILLCGLLGLLAAVGGGIYWAINQKKEGNGNGGGSSGSELEEKPVIPDTLRVAIEETKSAIASLKESYPAAKAQFDSANEAANAQISAWEATTPAPASPAPLAALKKSLTQLKDGSKNLEFPARLETAASELATAWTTAESAADPISEQGTIEQLLSSLTTDVSTAEAALARTKTLSDAVISAAKGVQSNLKIAQQTKPETIWLRENTAEVGQLREQARKELQSLKILETEVISRAPQSPALANIKSTTDTVTSQRDALKQAFDDASPTAEGLYATLQQTLASSATFREETKAALPAAVEEDLTRQPKDELNKNKTDVAERIELAKANSSVSEEELTQAINSLTDEKLGGLWPLGRVTFGYGVKSVSPTSPDFVQLAEKLASPNVVEIIGSKGQAKVVYVGFASRDIGKSPSDQARLDKINVRFSHDRAEALKTAVSRHVAADSSMPPEVKSFFSTEDRSTIRAVGVGAVELFKSAAEVGVEGDQRNQCAELWLAVFRK